MYSHFYTDGSARNCKHYVFFCITMHNNFYELYLEAIILTSFPEKVVNFYPLCTGIHDYNPVRVIRFIICRIYPHIVAVHRPCVAALPYSSPWYRAVTSGDSHHATSSMVRGTRGPRYECLAGWLAGSKRPQKSEHHESKENWLRSTNKRGYENVKHTAKE